MDVASDFAKTKLESEVEPAQGPVQGGVLEVEVDRVDDDLLQAVEAAHVQDLDQSLPNEPRRAALNHVQEASHRQLTTTATAKTRAIRSPALAAEAGQRTGRGLNHETGQDQGALNESLHQSDQEADHAMIVPGRDPSLLARIQGLQPVGMIGHLLGHGAGHAKMATLVTIRRKDQQEPLGL